MELEFYYTARKFTYLRFREYSQRKKCLLSRPMSGRGTFHIYV